MYNRHVDYRNYLLGILSGQVTCAALEEMAAALEWRAEQQFDATAAVQDEVWSENPKGVSPLVRSEAA